MRGDFTTVGSDELGRQRFDLLVVGGGIHGLFAAYDASLRGLSVALVERSDFASGLSFNHQRTLHGGLRSLQGGNLARSREQIRERRAWAVMAPHLVRSLPFIIGTYRWTKRSRTAVRAGFALYDVLGRRRNVDVAPELHLPKPRLESAAATRRLFPGVADQKLSGGAIWYDYQTVHPDRLAWTVALAAVSHGARLVNYAEALVPLRESGRLAGMRVRDPLTGAEQDVHAQATLFAAGSGLGALLSAVGADGAPPLVRAMNLLVDRPARDIAMVARGSTGRMLTAVPWRGRLLIGTHQSSAFVDRAEARPPAEAVEAFLSDLNETFPGFKVGRTDVRMIHHGLTPAIMRSGRPELMPEPVIVRHGTRGLPGLVSLVGVKYTTARLAAERAVDALCAELGRPKTVCQTSRLELPHAGVADVEGRLLESLRGIGHTLDRDVIAHLGSWYGTEAPTVVEHAHAAGELERIVAEGPLIVGEISYAVERGAVRRLSDVVMRRTPLGSAGHPGRAALERTADLMGAKLGWDRRRRDEELAAVEALYPSAVFAPEPPATGRG